MSFNKRVSTPFLILNARLLCVGDSQSCSSLLATPIGFYTKSTISVKASEIKAATTIKKYLKVFWGDAGNRV